MFHTIYLTTWKPELTLKQQLELIIAQNGKEQERPKHETKTETEDSESES